MNAYVFKQICLDGTPKHTKQVYTAQATVLWKNYKEQKWTPQQYENYIISCNSHSPAVNTSASSSLFIPVGSTSVASTSAGQLKDLSNTHSSSSHSTEPTNTIIEGNFFYDFFFCLFL